MGITVMRPQGTIDMNSAPAFRQLLEAEVQRSERGLIVALSEVAFMDSAGIAVLIEGLKWSRERTLPYLLTQLTPAVQMVIELARLEQFFTIVTSVEDGVVQITHPS
jgi:anti-sigma B factor antagonist